MAYLSLCRIHPTGLRMATRSILYVSLISLSLGLYSAQNIKIESSSSGWSPLLGFYAKSEPGLIVFYSNNSDIKLHSTVKCISVQDFNEFSCKTISTLKEINPKDVMPGYMQDLISDAHIMTYKLLCQSENNRKNKCEIGIVLTENSKIISLKNYSLIRIINDDKKYDLQICLGHENIHVKCYEISKNALVSHFSYYLGYEIDPELVDKDIDKFIEDQ